jgi:Virulence-associated protein E-like domain/Bifunctional DNA primase/polymerase, N-terminal
MSAKRSSARSPGKPAIKVVQQQPVLAAALDLLGRGIAPVPVEPRGKAGVPDWDTVPVTPDNAPQRFAGNRNIGVRLGAASGGLCDADLDCPEAVALAPKFLPPTKMISGRSGNPRSHWFYRSDLYESEQRASIQYRAVDGAVICELRTGGGGAAALTVVPPSTHPGGEQLEWHQFGESSQQPGAELKLTVAKLAAAALLARHWPAEGGRHDAAVTVDGYLTRQKWSKEDRQHFIEAVVSVAGDDEVRDRKRVSNKTEQRLADDKPVRGFPALCKTFGKDVAELVDKWLGSKNTELMRKTTFPDLTKERRPRPTLPNTKVALAQFGIECRYDLFKLRYLIDGHQIENYVGEVSDPGLLALRELIHEQFEFDPTTETVLTAVQTLANHARFHPVRDYLDGLQWDGTPRIDNWLTTYGGADDTPYSRAIGALLLVAAVRRVRKPGCKFDELVVFQSEQGTDKSQALQLLAVQPEWFSDNLPLGLSAKETIEALSGHWIVEASELQGMRKGEIERVKAFLSRDTDRARMAYARTVTEARRQCVVVGTTNSEQFLRDLTGNRRFWPVRIKQFDLEALRRDRDQLWAEAAAREAAGASIRLPRELWPAAALEQQERVVENPFVSVLDRTLREYDEKVPAEHDKRGRVIKPAEFVEGPSLEGKITTEDLWTIVGLRPVQRTQPYCELLGAAMQQLGWEKTNLRVGHGARAYHYVRGPQPYRRISVVVDRDSGKPSAFYDDNLKA